MLKQMKSGKSTSPYSKYVLKQSISDTPDIPSLQKYLNLLFRLYPPPARSMLADSIPESEHPFPVPFPDVKSLLILEVTV